MLSMLPYSGFNLYVYNGSGVANTSGGCSDYPQTGNKQSVSNQKEVSGQKSDGNHGANLAMEGLQDVEAVSQSEDTIHLYWYGQAGVRIGDLSVKWEDLKLRDNFNAFVTLLIRLGEYQLRDIISASDVVEVIQSVIESPSICQLIFEASEEADADCHNRTLSIFNTVQGLARFSKLENAGATQRELLTLAKGIAKQALLDEATVQLLNYRWSEGRHASSELGVGPDMSESLEYQMVLRRKLGKELHLPFPVEVSCGGYSAFRLSEMDMEFALAYVIRRIWNEDYLAELLISQPIWRQYMERVCTKEKAKIDDYFLNQMAHLESEYTTSFKKEIYYVNKMNKLGRQRQQKIDELLKLETKKIDARSELRGNTQNSVRKNDGCTIF